MEDEQGSLQYTVLLIIGLKVFVHATGVGHLLAVGLWQEPGVVHSLLLVEQDVGRVRIDFLRVHFLLTTEQQSFRVGSVNCTDPR